LISKERRQLMGLTTVAGGLSLLGASALHAQTPTRLAQTKVLNGFPPGDMIDTIARGFAERLKGTFADVAIVENKPGAGGRIALVAMKGLAADGANVLFTPSPMVVLYPHVFKTLTYDPLKDLTPVARTAVACYALSVGPGVPASVKTLAQFLDWCRANPKLASYGTSGAGTSIHLTGANLARLSGVPLTMIPYKGGSLAANDLIAGQVPAVMSTAASVMEFVKAGKARFLAVSSAQRWPGLPDVPTFAESGFAQLTGVDWFGVFLPANAPQELVQRLHMHVQRAGQSPELIAQLNRLGIQMLPSQNPQEFAEQIRSEHAKWAEVVTAIGFDPQD
jgi:tripartite-type tricarboxylate transporter receptor subunit TctC